MITLAHLLTRLESRIPILDGIPTSTQLGDAVTGAVLDFSRRAGRGNTTDLTLQAGVAIYPLPADFLKLVRVEPGGDFPMTPTTFPGHMLDPQSHTLVVYPVPGSLASPSTPNTTWRIHYLAAYVVRDGIVAGLGDAEAEIVLLKAQALVIGYQIRREGANDITGYNQGNLSVQRKSSPAEALRRQQLLLDDEYREAVRVYLGVR